MHVDRLNCICTQNETHKLANGLISVTCVHAWYLCVEVIHLLTQSTSSVDLIIQYAHTYHMQLSCVNPFSKGFHILCSHYHLQEWYSQAYTIAECH